jgi:hypothetical protein
MTEQDEERLTRALGSVASAVLYDRCPTGMEVVAWRALGVGGHIKGDQIVLDSLLRTSREDAERAWQQERPFGPGTKMLGPFLVDEAEWGEVHARHVKRVDGVPITEPGWRLGDAAVIVMGRAEQEP